MSRLFIGFGIISCSFIASTSFVFALEQSSTNYKNVDPTFSPAVFDISSPNFSITAALDPIVGLSNSVNFNIRHGVPIKDSIFPPSPTSTPPGPVDGGGGGGGGLLPTPTTSSTPATTTQLVISPPSLIFRSPTFLSKQTISGLRPVEALEVLVNGSSKDVQMLPGLNWERSLPLFVGYNELRIQAKDEAGHLSVIISGTLERMLIGDASREIDAGREHIVDDVDLSRFTRAWKKYNFYSDFNEDGKIDDVDLSLLASHWNMKVTY